MQTEIIVLLKIPSALNTLGDKENENRNDSSDGDGGGA